ncbi:hypothetical protein [uncultured Oscillibacter sp.]|uniref:hypothetical protein n=1 Tax=uncultured Oscillibacter sp. TaxID=876091 RepID=UPI0025E832FD|nr:hypothetical protein [uncultured Oscillibacter sp.]
MKIYNRRNFAVGLVCLGLAAVCGILMAVQGVSVKLLVSTVLLAALGWADLAWAVDKSMGMPLPDERDRQVVQRSAWRAYRLLTDGCLLAAGGMLIAYGVWRSPLVLAAGTTLVGVVLAAFLLLLGANVFYEKRL